MVWARTDNGRFLRVGMSILIEEYPYLDVTRDVDADFLWFISAADPEVLTGQFGMSNPPALGRVLIDNAIVLSQNAGLGGRIGLHAAVTGGETLLALYERCGLLPLPLTAQLPPAVRRPNDGRFFCLDEPSARVGD